MAGTLKAVKNFDRGRCIVRGAQKDVWNLCDKLVPVVLRTVHCRKRRRRRLYFVLTVILRKAEAEHHVRKVATNKTSVMVKAMIKERVGVVRVG